MKESSYHFHGWRRLSAWLLGLAIGSVASSAAESQNLPREETQLWFDGSMSVPVNDRISLTGIGTLRMGRGLDHFVTERAGAAVSCRVFQWLSVSPFYNYIGSQPLPSRAIRENRAGLDATVAWHLQGFNLSDRHRLEVRVWPAATSHRYRNRFQIQHPLQIRHQRVVLTFSDEIYRDSVQSKWTRNRFYVGIERSISHNFNAELYYLRQNDHYSKPGDLHALGVTIRWRISRLH